MTLQVVISALKTGCSTLQASAWDCVRAAYPDSTLRLPTNWCLQNIKTTRRSKIRVAWKMEKGNICWLIFSERKRLSDLFDRQHRSNISGNEWKSLHSFPASLRNIEKFSTKTEIIRVKVLVDSKISVNFWRAHLVHLHISIPSFCPPYIKLMEERSYLNPPFQTNKNTKNAV